MASLENAKFWKKTENATGIRRLHVLHPISDGVKYNHTYILHIYDYKIIVECWCACKHTDWGFQGHECVCESARVSVRRSNCATLIRYRWIPVDSHIIMYIITRCSYRLGFTLYVLHNMISASGIAVCSVLLTWKGAISVRDGCCIVICRRKTEN